MVFNVFYVTDADHYAAVSNRHMNVGDVASYQEGPEISEHEIYGCDLISLGSIPYGFFDDNGNVLMKVQDGNVVPINPPEVL